MFKRTFHICRAHIHSTRSFSSNASDQLPLSGIRVLDLSRVLAGPYCTMILGDLGAEIVKIEHPMRGCDTRAWGPPFVGSNDADKESCYFLSVNRNKKSVGINIKDPEGRDLVAALARQSDVLVENYLPGKLSQMGLGYDDLKDIAPNLIYCSITGFGVDGPYSNRAGYDVIAASIGGLLHITGEPNGPPCKVGVALTDVCTGLYAHGAIMAALLARAKSGRGQKIDCNLLATQVSTLVNLSSSYLNGGIEAQRQGTAHASIVPYQSFQTKDGYMTIGCGNDHQFQEFCQKIGLPQVCLEDKYQSNELRVHNREELIELLTTKMGEKTNEEWTSTFDGAGFPYGPVNNLSQVFADPQVKHLGLEQTVSHPKVGEIKQVGPPVKFSASSNRIQFAPPVLGSHTREVLADLLNLDEERLNELSRKGVINP
ncbi:hypothetical protein TCAL_05566 [Tigriopus californicus]|uniref:Succinate--hydroxymethylglutarate CoA-transferase n=1 Tax=Tigriopus californicus TaxID=6832 RepID=A0A553NC49_TIGCA|nr:succinate--hydroxymethylglutarate CoA-transferase-like [Tigriopus californicus]TRY63024.1 hypothetical protein TCAL_05566 [Tigriopus californicus]|eukprot:TCALIF_05566-PA protein Name:"Similar to SUGCT Succinate--hydroxymethylglutarate CoA-transferase (Homo sapiens)" AED:0.08 eAED:0.08 QI:82/0.66/0.25/1/1/1/4/0/427